MTPTTRHTAPQQPLEEDPIMGELRADSTAAESSRRIRKRKRSKGQVVADDGEGEGTADNTEPSAPRVYHCPFSKEARVGRGFRCTEGPWKARRSVLPRRLRPRSCASWSVILKIFDTDPVSSESSSSTPPSHSQTTEMPNTRKTQRFGKQKSF
jgi:hypothetical protein